MRPPTTATTLPAPYASLPVGTPNRWWLGIFTAPRPCQARKPRTLKTGFRPVHALPLRKPAARKTQLRLDPVRQLASVVRRKVRGQHRAATVNRLHKAVGDAAGAQVIDQRSTASCQSA